MSKELQYNPKEGRNCISCAYNEKKMGTAHRNCMRTFQVGKYLPAKLTNEDTKQVQNVACYIDQASAEMVVKGELKVQVACTIKINQWSRMFPIDYDPHWVVVCTGWSKERDERFTREDTPFDQMMGILGSVGRI
jgi:hypothetical protein